MGTAIRVVPPRVASAPHATSSFLLGAPASSASDPEIHHAELDDDFVSGDTVSEIIVDDFGPSSRLNELLGGIKRFALLLVAGKAGAGKSTAAAELATAVVEHWTSRSIDRELRDPGCRIYWLDSDQNDPALVRQCFATVGPRAEAIFTSRIQLLNPKRQYTWSQALARVPDHARVVVCDSLEKWGRSDPERLNIMDDLRRHQAWLKIVLAGANKNGLVSGSESLERADDATIHARAIGEGMHRKFTLHSAKHRWPPCASWLSRQPIDEPPEAEDDPEAEEEIHEPEAEREIDEPPEAEDDPEAEEEIHEPEAEEEIDEPPEEEIDEPHDELPGALGRPGILDLRRKEPPPPPLPARPLPVPTNPPPASRPGRATPPSAVPHAALSVAGPPTPGPRAPAPDLPDFSEAFLVQAARWGTAEMRRYKAQCRAKPVPPDTLRWWVRAVDEARRTMASEPVEGIEADPSSKALA